MNIEYHIKTVYDQKNAIQLQRHVRSINRKRYGLVASSVSSHRARSLYTIQQS